jgi:hypothetical protein
MNLVYKMIGKTASNQRMKAEQQGFHSMFVVGLVDCCKREDNL